MCLLQRYLLCVFWRRWQGGDGNHVKVSTLLGPFFGVISGLVKNGKYSILGYNGKQLWHDYYSALHIYKKSNFLQWYSSFRSMGTKKKKELEDGYSSDHSDIVPWSFIPSTPPVKKMYRPMNPSTPSRQQPWSPSNPNGTKQHWHAFCHSPEYDNVQQRRNHQASTCCPSLDSKTDYISRTSLDFKTEHTCDVTNTKTAGSSSSSSTNEQPTSDYNLRKRQQEHQEAASSSSSTKHH